jgi:hypothetical protein
VRARQHEQNIDHSLPPLQLHLLPENDRQQPVDLEGEEKSLGDGQSRRVDVVLLVVDDLAAVPLAHLDEVMELLLRMLGISHTKNTKVGSAVVRGVSGGERKVQATSRVVPGSDSRTSRHLHSKTCRISDERCEKVFRASPAKSSTTR